MLSARALTNDNDLGGDNTKVMQRDMRCAYLIDRSKESFVGKEQPMRRVCVGENMGPCSVVAPNPFYEKDPWFYMADAVNKC